MPALHGYLYFKHTALLDIMATAGVRNGKLDAYIGSRGSTNGSAELLERLGPANVAAWVPGWWVAVAILICHDASKDRGRSARVALKSSKLGQFSKHPGGDRGWKTDSE